MRILDRLEFRFLAAVLVAAGCMKLARMDASTWRMVGAGELFIGCYCLFFASDRTARRMLLVVYGCFCVVALIATMRPGSRCSCFGGAESSAVIVAAFDCVAVLSLATGSHLGWAKSISLPIQIVLLFFALGGDSRVVSVDQIDNDFLEQELGFVASSISEENVILLFDGACASCRVVIDDLLIAVSDGQQIAADVILVNVGSEVDQEATIERLHRRGCRIEQANSRRTFGFLPIVIQMREGRVTARTIESWQDFDTGEN